MGVIALFGFLNRWNDSMGSALEDLPIEKGKNILWKTLIGHQANIGFKAWIIETRKNLEHLS